MSAATRTITLPKPDVIPAELQKLRQWVAWTYKHDGGKLPLDAKTGRAASSADPKTWTTFDVAYSYAQENHAGIGIVFSRDDPYVGIDLDRCIDETGNIDAATYDLLQTLNSYSEISPSGRGIKSIVKAHVARAFKSERIEIYPHSRFFTITGNTVAGLPTVVRDAQDAVDALIAEYFPNSNGHSSEPLPERIPEGARNNSLTSLGGLLRRRGLSQSTIEATLLSVNEAQCEPPLPEAEVRRIARSVSRYEPEPKHNEASADETLQKDYGHAAVLAGLFKDEYRWAVHRSTWMHYESGVWRSVPEEAVAKEAADTLRQHYAAELASATDKAAVLELTKRIAETCTYARITGALSFLKGWPGILTLAEEWDKNPCLLNIQNGTLDLKNCTLKPHDPADLLTKQDPVTYDPEARSTRWQQHIEMFVPDPEVRRQIQRDMGLSLVGADMEEILPIWWGDGGRGKSTTLRVFRAILGDYAQMAAPRLLLASKYERHSTELADLCGSRLVFSVEIGQGSHLDEERVKVLTGGESVKARYMYKDHVEFPRTWTICLVCNHKPVIKGRDNGIWRRIRLIPWTVEIPKEKRRPQEDVVNELLEDRNAILAWLVQGLKDWYRDQQWIANAVMVATESYRAEMDLLGDFLEECCVLKPRATVPKAELYAAYENWCERNHERPVSKKAFTGMLEERGIGEDRAHAGVRLYTGIGLRVTDGDSLSVTSHENYNFPKSYGKSVTICHHHRDRRSRCGHADTCRQFFRNFP